MTSPAVNIFTSTNFKTEVLQSDLPVLVDFWAEWCGPCRMIGPIIDELAGEMAGKLKVGKVNIDEHGDVASNYGIQSIPTLLLFVGGELKETLLGARPKAQIVEKILPHLSKP